MFKIEAAAREYIDKKGGHITAYLREQTHGGG